MSVVLIVEDDASVMEVTSLLLEDAGYEVLPAEGAEQALRAAEERPDIDVIFTDVNLREGLNGIELARMLKERGSRAAMIVVSGDLGWSGVSLAPYMHFLAKPYGRNTLLTVVAEACAKRKLA
ncbi:response regulator [Dyella sp. ASV21]|uniref:response regulator n=1 Tax=Dyella sp. ASV21 TaxID=2795114 RepID=UPI0018EB17C4|nr:response regulator [Dyella sp. ASV21]